MVGANEIREAAVETLFPMTALENTKMQSRPAGTRLGQNVVTARAEIDLSGTQILTGLASALSFMTLFLWALLKLWLAL